MNKFKYELHCHTSDCDRCAKESGAEIVKLYSSKGYDGIVITDHYFSLCFDWFKDEICGYSRKKVIERLLKGYYSARNEGEKAGLTVLCGAEVRLADTINDYLIYGLEENDFYELPYLNKMKNLEALVNVLPDYAIVVQAHPFRDNMTVLSPELISGVEVYNGGTEKIRNKMARMYAEYYKKIMTSGSDFNGTEHLARGGITTHRKINTSKELVDVLKSGEYEIIAT